MSSYLFGINKLVESITNERKVSTMFCNDFTNAVKHGTITLGEMTDRDDNTIYLDFAVRVNGTSARINYCPFCSRIVRGRYDLEDVKEVIGGNCHTCGDEIDVEGRDYCSSGCAKIAGVDIGSLPDEVYSEPF